MWRCAALELRVGSLSRSSFGALELMNEPRRSDFWTDFYTSMGYLGCWAYGLAIVALVLFLAYALGRSG